MSKVPVGLYFAWLVLLWPAWSHAQTKGVPRASEVVEPRSYVSLEPVPRGRAFEVAIVAKIRPGFHINAHRVLQDYLIPTALHIAPAAGFRIGETIYPSGVLHSFKFSPEKLSVYEGEVTLRVKLEAPPDAPLGPQKLAMTLHYQACNEETCLPPVKLPVLAEFVAVPANVSARQAHAGIFQSPEHPKTHSPR